MKNTILRVWHASILGVAAFLMVVALGTGLFSGWSTLQGVERATRSYEVMAETDRAVATIRDAGTEIMGFVNSGGEAYRDSFEGALAVVSRSMEKLKELVRDNPRQLKRVRELEELLARRINDLRETITIRQERGAESARVFLSGESALRRVTEVRQVQREIEAEENTLLGQRQSRLRNTMRVSAFTVTITGALSLLLALNAFLLMRRALSALKRQAELLRAKERAERSDREKSEFLANMSHEIRTPMNAVLGFAELLGSQVASPKQRQYVEAINTSGKALLAMINDILDLSKIEAGRLDLSLRPTSLRSVFHGISTVFAQQAAERGLKLEFFVDASVPPSLLFDAIRLRQILFNVVGNALKFTPRGAIQVRVWSTLTPEDETTVTLHLSVNDSGIGIARENLDLIFEPFRQVDVEKNAHPGGTGLGLSITKRLTEMLNGRITVDSGLGQGTTFFFDFQKVPISAALPDDERAAPPDEDLDRLRPSLVLVVDDVALNRELLSGYFEGTRHRLLFASGGREAIEIAKRFPPDVVLMDIRMPDLDGRSARDEIRKLPELAATPMIAVTASSLLAEEVTLRKIFEGYVRKPFTRAALYDELAKLLPEDRMDDTHPDDTPSLALGSSDESDVASPGDPKLWIEFLTYLQTVEAKTWPSLSKSMGVRESEAFARDIGVWAQRAGCPPAREYAKKLLGEVQAFDIQGQEMTMKSFPQMVRQIASAVEGAVR